MDDYARVSRTLAQYCQLVDDHRYDDWGALFTEDGTMTMTDGTHHLALEGRKAILDYAHERFPSHGPRRHLTLNSVIDVDGAAATARSDMIVVVESPAGPRIAVTGRYEDMLVREDRWRFTSRTVVVCPELTGPLG